MPTYYVQPNGNDSNTGLGPATNQAWKTIQKALGASGIASGDTLYIAPGVYRESITIGGTYTAPTYIIGDPSAAYFSGINSGEVRITGFSSDTSNTSLGTTIIATNKNYLNWSNIFFQNYTRCVLATTCLFWTFTKCYFQSLRAGNLEVNPCISISGIAGSSMGLVITSCILDATTAIRLDPPKHSVTYDAGIAITNCFFNIPNNQTYPYGVYINSSAGTTFPTGGSIVNCTFVGTSSNMGHISAEYGWNPTTPFIVRNCLSLGAGRFLQFVTASSCAESYNRYPNGTISGVTASPTSSSAGVYGMDLGYNNLVGITPTYPYASSIGGPNTSFGSSTYALPNDMFGVAWSGNNPDAGSATYRSLSNIGTFAPIEKNIYSITKNQNSTSQTLELYLGATGISYNTSGLQAYYVRNRGTATGIALTFQTSNGAWISGGFAEINSTYMPGLYRLDVPNAAFNSGSEDVTITVRGASGTNGAVVNCQLLPLLSNSSIASTVWNYITQAGISADALITMTSNELDLIVDQVGNVPQSTWAYTLSNSQTAEDNLVNIASGGTAISAYDVWNYASRTITGGNGSTAEIVFPENFEFMLITNTGRIYVNKADIQKIRS